ncbi:hypothetical protein [Microbacterium sp. XT11]|uniref:hypothetical protein n=1 Tax=Microbacterium sp. XT11 TaxID=367477 RepID=UPI001E2ED609|nr:hypothetical protein [Microbacterium sp. XT11]
MLVLSTGRQPVISDYWSTVAGLGGWLSPAFTNGFSAIQTVGMVLVAVAAFTGLAGDWQSVPPRARRFIRPLAGVCTVTIGAMGALTPLAVVHSPATASTAVLLWMCCWAVMLFGLGVSEIAPLRRRMIFARARHVRALRLLERDPLPAAPTRPELVLAVVAICVIPVVVTYAACGLVALMLGSLWPLQPAMLLLSYSGYVAHLGWLIRADRTQSTAYRRLGGFIVLIGGAIGVLFGLPLLAIPPAGFAFIILGLLTAVVLLLPRITTRLWPYRVISAYATNRGKTAIDEQAARLFTWWKDEVKRSVAARPRQGLRARLAAWLTAP